MSKAVVTLVLMSLWLLPVKAQDNTNHVLEIELVTIGAGEYYWEAFGHSALRVKTDTHDYMFGFGYFDFEEEDFFLKFAKGEMRYFLGIQSTDVEFSHYKNQGRKILIQRLELSTTQKNELVTQLNFLARPENKYYHYDYFLNNCTSQIRDLLDEVTHGEISNQLSSVNNGTSWNDLTFPAVNQTWMNLGMALAYGLPAYFDRNLWQQSVFPEVFAKDIKSLETGDRWNDSYQVYYQPSVEQSIFNRYDFFKTHYAMLLCVCIMVLLLFTKSTKKFATKFWLVFQSLLGLAILILWFATKHSVAAYNINVMLFIPFGFIFLFRRFNKVLLLNIFLTINILWLIVAAVMTNLYLIGFFLINSLVWHRLKSSLS